MLLKDKVALITGAATGIGQMSAHIFAREGARIVIADNNDKAGSHTVEQIRTNGFEASFIHADVTSVVDLKNMVARTIELYKKLDIFWHNAGVFYRGHLDLVEEKNFDHQMAVSLKGALFGTKFVVPEMRKAGGGCILFTSSMVGLRPSNYDPQYSITHGLAKASLVMLVRCLTEPLSKDNIRINCVCPGPVRTQDFEASQLKIAEVEGVSVDEIIKRRIAQRIPMQRAITMEEVAETALFLVSDKASAITGVALPADGGFAAI